MASLDLMPSTDRPAFSSGGASETGFRRRCAPVPLSETSGAESRWQLIPSPVEEAARILCHLLVSQIPDRGLHEALESLFEMWRFYRQPVPTMIEAPRLQSIPAKLGATYDRPLFHVTED